MSAGLPLSKQIFIHGFITSGGQKMSKSIGNVINPFDMVSKYGTDAVRFYLLREIPSLGDGDFSESRMKELYDSELANELGNLVSRITTLAEKDELKTQKSSFTFPDVFTKEMITEMKEYKFGALMSKIW
jgi:methionyl-tRNA synthetase